MAKRLDRRNVPIYPSIGRNSGEVGENFQLSVSRVGEALFVSPFRVDLFEAARERLTELDAKAPPTTLTSKIRDL